MKGFKVIVLGCTGGPRETNLSGYLLAPSSGDEFVALDAGSLLSGIEIAYHKKSFSDINFSNKNLSPSGEILKNHIKAYIISHAHLDHISGLVLNSQVDISKSILGIDPTIDNMRDYIFNGRTWPNYANEGVEPQINLYQYMRLPLHKKMAIPQTKMQVEAYLLSHPRGYPSTAFLIEYRDQYMLYFGDTSSDALELEKHLLRIWKRVAPLIKEKKLLGILLECSYSMQEMNQCIYGHLAPSLMLQELHTLADLSATNLEGLKVVVTHRKESLSNGVDMQKTIMEELNAMNDLSIELIFPSQGDKILF